MVAKTLSLQHGISSAERTLYQCRTKQDQWRKWMNTPHVPMPNEVFKVPLSIGEIITNKTLYTTFKCACEGGVRYSSTYQLLVLVSNFVDPRHTGGKWEENILYYTGSGKSGDQDIAKGTNKRLLTSLETSTPVFYFEVYTQGQYTYRGQVVSAAPPFQRQEPGADGEERKVWIFPLRLKTS